MSTKNKATKVAQTEKTMAESGKVLTTNNAEILSTTEDAGFVAAFRDECQSIGTGARNLLTFMAEHCDEYPTIRQKLFTLVCVRVDTGATGTDTRYNIGTGESVATFGNVSDLLLSRLCRSLLISAIRTYSTIATDNGTTLRKRAELHAWSIDESDVNNAKRVAVGWSFVPITNWTAKNLLLTPYINKVSGKCQKRAKIGDIFDAKGVVLKAPRIQGITDTCAKLDDIAKTDGTRGVARALNAIK